MIDSSYNFWLRLIFWVISVKVKLFISLLCIAWKSHPQNNLAVSGMMLNPTLWLTLAQKKEKPNQVNINLRWQPDIGSKIIQPMDWYWY